MKPGKQSGSTREGIRYSGLKEADEYLEKDGCKIGRLIDR